jgi:glucosamine--fructose-6-phosphate aminotransferase (isomerizing)
VHKLKGTFALVMMFEDQPGIIYAIRNVSPIVAAECADGMMLASDLTALGNFTKEYFVMPEYSILKLTPEKMTITNLEGEVIEPEMLKLDWKVSGLGKEGYPFYMEKEIMEQPRVFAETIKNRIVNGLPDFTADGLPDNLLTECNRICIIACGTAMHVGLITQALVKSILHMHIDVELASEFMYSDPVIDEKTLVIAVSQSGETVDTLEAVKYAKKCGAKCLAVLNVRGSSISRVSDYVLYTEAGPEIAVASTKAYTTQLAVMYMVVAKMALLQGAYSEEDAKAYIAELQKVSEKMEQILDRRNEVHVIAKEVLEAKDLFMIGRGMDYSILLEGSLKLKEVSYIHSEAYASGELKHGPIALITENTPVVALVTQGAIMSKELSNIKEVKARGANVVLFIKEELKAQLKEDYNVVALPDLDDKFMVFPSIVALQLLAYYVSSDKGFDVDKPRNLAKVVTVE